ncbi:MAG: sulfurtransferase TusA family protein, partial [Acidimicrobiales bacterium]
MVINSREDTSGLNCPLPILKTKKALKNLTVGHVLEVITTDSGSVKDMHAFCNQTGHILLELEEDEGKYIFRI